MDLLEKLDFKDVKESGFPKAGQRVVLHCEAIYTAEYESDDSHPPKGKWLIDKPRILNVQQWSEITEEQYEEIKKKYW